MKTNQRTSGIIYILSSYSNTRISISDRNGNVISSLSFNSLGIKINKENDCLAIEKLAKIIAIEAKKKGIKTVSVIVKGPGIGRTTSIHAIKTAGLKIDMIKDITPVPHNGVRPVRKTDYNINKQGESIC